jgi:membrane protease subunit HflK
MDKVLGGSRQQIADDVRTRMQEMLDRYSTGILISAVAIQNAQPPEQVQAAFDDAVKAGQDRDRQVNEGQAYANDVVPKARGLASRIAQEAEGYRTRVIETAQGDAARFRQVLAEYSKAPAVTRTRLYLDTMQQVFANTTKLLIDTRSASNLMVVPLDKLLQGAAAEAAAQAAVAPVAGAAVPPADASNSTDNRMRDGQRSRDRETR